MPSSKFPLVTSVTCSDVEEWLRKAWPNEASYPHNDAIYTLTVYINAVPEREKVRTPGDPAADAFKRRRLEYIHAQKQARSLLRALGPVLYSLENNVRQLEAYEVDITNYPLLPEQIKTIENVQKSVKFFLGLGRQPRFQDHMDPIIWIADAVEKAWKSRVAMKSDYKLVSLSTAVEGPLVYFIWMTLIGIGLGRDGEPGNSREKISEHLRGRQNRPRDRKRAAVRG